MRACHYEGLVSISVLDVSHTAVKKNLECCGCGLMLYLEILVIIFAFRLVNQISDLYFVAFLEYIFIDQISQTFRDIT